MKKVLAMLCLVVIAGAVSTASAQEYKTALGIRISNAAPIVHNSVSIRHFLNEKMAIEGLVSLDNPLSFGALVEIHKPVAASGVNWFYGAGGYFGFVKTYNVQRDKNETEANFGAQGIVGLDYKFANIPLNLSLDWKPELNLVSDIHFEPAAIGFTARFTFGSKQ